MSDQTPKTGIASMEEPDDDELIQAVLAGDGDSYSLLVRRYQNNIHRFLLKYRCGYETARDLTQETFIDGYERLATFRGESRFLSWLIGIALNKVRKYLERSPEMRFDFVSDEMLESHCTANGNPHHALERKCFLKSLYVQICNLPDDLRESFLLVVFDDLTYQEAAGILGIPLGTVKNRVFKAREILKKIPGR